MSDQGLDARMTALVLRDIAVHLADGEALMLDGTWSSEYVDHAAPRGHSKRRHYENGRRQANTDAIYALLRIAEMNDPGGSWWEAK